MSRSPHASLFPTRDPTSTDRLAEMARAVVAAVARATEEDGPRSPATAEELAAGLAGLDVCPPRGLPFDEVVADLAERVLAHGVRPSDPATAAHLHPPPLLAGVAAELAVAATNQSLDSWDQAPAATALELHLVGWLARTLGLPPSASGVLTAGGTASNLLGLALAREAAGHRAGVRVAADGLPPEASRWRIVASTDAHFSVRRAAAVLGLGRAAVVPVATDEQGRLDPAALDRELAAAEQRDEVPIAVVATAGTTDLGAVDPLDAVGRRAADAGAWFHVDAAVGSGLALSDRHAHLLAGIERADSVTADLHKLWWQPIGASALLVRDPATFDLLREPSDYLDRDDDRADGVVNLVGRSLDTTRRFDALKVVVALRATGRERLGSMVDHVVALAQAAADEVWSQPDLELLAPPATVTCVFRWRPDDDAGVDLDHVVTETARRLLASGRAVLGRTRRDGVGALKLTFVNPAATADDARALVRLVAAEARSVAAEAR